MCAAAALFAGSAALQLGGALFSSSAENAQNAAAYNRKVQAINKQADAIVKSTTFNYALDGLQEQQIQNASQVRTEQAQRKLEGAQDEASAAAASSGVSGNSVKELYSAYATATGHDIMSIKADENNQMTQAEFQKRQQQMSAKNQILALQTEIPDQPNPTANTLGHIFSAALGIGKSFMANTTPLGKGSSGGLFGNGGILGIGRDWG